MGRSQHRGSTALAGAPVTPSQRCVALNRSFPGSTKWPIACAGQSGGAKRASYLAPLLAVAGYRIAGIFLDGDGQERFTEGYRRFQPGSSFLRTPIFLSSGLSDPIATIEQQAAVKNAMQRTGFTNIRHETFPGGHTVLPHPGSESAPLVPERIVAASSRGALIFASADEAKAGVVPSCGWKVTSTCARSANHGRRIRRCSGSMLLRLILPPPNALGYCVPATFRYPNHFLARARQDFPANLGAGPHFDSDLNPSNKFIARQPVFASLGVSFLRS